MSDQNIQFQRQMVVLGLFELVQFFLNGDQQASVFRLQRFQSRDLASNFFFDYSLDFLGIG